MRWRRGSSNKRRHRPARPRRRRAASALPVGGGLGLAGRARVPRSCSSLGGGTGGGFDDPGRLRPAAPGAGRRPIPAGQDPEPRPDATSGLRLQRRAVDVASGLRGAGPSRTTARSSCSTPPAWTPGLRLRQLGGRAVLLPGRPARLPRPVLLPRHGVASSAPRATSRGVRHRPRAGHHVQSLVGTSDRSARCGTRIPGAATSCRCGSSSRRTATRASGRAACSRPATSRRATSTRRSARPRRSATTGCSSRPAGGVDPDSFTHGSSAQRRRWFDRGRESAASRRPATRSPPRRSDR